MDELLNIYVENPQSMKNKKIKSIISNISNNQFNNAMKNNKYTNEQKSIIKNLYDQKKLLDPISTPTTDLELQLYEHIENPDMKLLYNKLQNIVEKLNGDKDTEIIITALIKLIMDDQMSIKMKQNNIIQYLKNLYKKN